MKTLHDVMTERKSSASNNFLLLRLLAATLVIYGHSFALAPKCDNCKDIASRITGSPWILSHHIGLYIFFVISGFLVTKSCIETPSTGTYFTKRALRIFPGLAVCVLLMIFVFGFIFTSLPASEYLTSPGTWKYLFRNATAYRYSTELPGFSIRGGDFATAVNSSLWTIPIEARLYILAGVASVAALRSRLALNLLLAGFGILAVFNMIPTLYQSAADYQLAGLFGFGALLYINRHSVPYSPKGLALLVVLAILSNINGSYFLLWSLALAYGCIVFAYAPKIPLPRWVGDYSYGIYLYGFPIQQLIAHFLPDAGPYEMFVIATPLAWIAGAISWKLVEQPFLKLKRRTPKGSIAEGNNGPNELRQPA